MGRALIIAGSADMPGAAILAVGGALRAGVGYAVLSCLDSVAAAVAGHYPETVLQTHGGADTCLQEDHLAAILQQVALADAICIGPGLGTDPQTAALTLSLLRGLAANWPHKALLLDADGLNHLAASSVSLAALGLSSTVLTPHPGEAARLLKLSSAADVQAQRPQAAQELAAQSGATVVLKGEGSLVATGSGQPWHNPSGNAGMATAGSGDVLSGVLTALLARGLQADHAARLATYLHGRAGDLAAAEVGQESLIASDLIRFLPTAIREQSADPS